MPTERMECDPALQMPGAESSDDEEALLLKVVKTKIRNNDITGARELTEGSKSLLKHGPAMLAVCDVLLAASLDFMGYGVDWYWVLQAFALADTATIKAQYQKLSSLLLLIKDGFPHAMTALKLVQDAYDILSDPTSRASFDHKRNGIWKLQDQSNSGRKCGDVNGKKVINALTETMEAATTANVCEEQSYAQEIAAVKLSERNSSSQMVLENSEGKDTSTSTNVQTIPEFGSSRFTSASQSSGEASCSSDISFKHFINPPINTMATATSDSDVGMPNKQPRWSTEDFMAEQVWAVYGDGPDLVPRLYVKVVGIASPCKVSVTFLEPNPMLDEEIQWVEEDLPVACGVFKAGRMVVNLDLTRFSHVMKCDKSHNRSFYRIFPRKGEIWALYKNWNNNWRRSDIIRHQSQVVEVLSDFSTDSCVSICSLVEVDGYMTFFQRRICEGSMLVKKILRSELLSFSHQIPAYTVLGIKDPAVPRESWHLEPDALPPLLVR